MTAMLRAGRVSLGLSCLSFGAAAVALPVGLAQVDISPATPPVVEVSTLGVTGLLVAMLLFVFALLVAGIGEVAAA